MRRNLISRPLVDVAELGSKNLLASQECADVLVEAHHRNKLGRPGSPKFHPFTAAAPERRLRLVGDAGTITNPGNIIRHLAAVFNIRVGTHQHGALQTENIAIENNLVYDISTSYNLPGHPPNGWVRHSRHAPKNVTSITTPSTTNGSNLIRLLPAARRPTATTKIRGCDHRQQLARHTYGIAGDSHAQGNDSR